MYEDVLIMFSLDLQKYHTKQVFWLIIILYAREIRYIVCL